MVLLEINISFDRASLRATKGARLDYLCQKLMSKLMPKNWPTTRTTARGKHAT